MNMYNIKSEKGFKEGIDAALRGDIDRLKQKTRHGMNLEDTDECARSILHYAVLGGNLEIVRYLVLTCQMDPTFADKWLITPYDLSCRPSENEVLQDTTDEIYQKYYINGNDDRSHIYEFFKEYLGFELDNVYRNPVLRSFHADPSIVRVGDDYYMVNSSFIYFPGIPISHSKDLVHWEIIGYAVTDPKWASQHLSKLEGGRGFWAPDISYFEGRFYICATLRNNDDMEYPQTQIVTSSDKPEGPYETPIIHNIRGIDPSLFTDDDGKRYMLLNRGACLVEVSLDGKKILSDPEMIAYGWSGHAPEGPHLIKKDGYYYCFLAEGGTGRGHMITVLRSGKLRGPYENCPYNPIMTQKDPIAPIQCCGHGKPVQTPDGRWFMVYLCERMIDGKWGMLGRETALDEITWTMDGWPLVNNRKGPSYVAKLPLGTHLTDQRALPYKGWLFARCADKDHVNVRENGELDIKGDGRDLCDIGCRSFAVYNQKDFACKDEFVMDVLYESKEELFGDEAGAVLYYDENSFIKFALRITNGDCSQVVIAEYKDNTYISEKIYDASFQKRNTFTIYTDNTERTMIFNGRKICTLTGVTGICSEGLSKGKRFTSATVGVYVFGKGEYLFAKKAEM